MMTHRGYAPAAIELDEEAGIISGRVALALGRDMATFEGRTVAEAAVAFRDTVDDYLAMCAERGMEPEPPAPSAVPALAMR